MRSAPGTPAAIAICFGQALRAAEAAAREALADARHPEQAVELLEQRLAPSAIVSRDVAAQEHGDVVLLEQRLRRITREADGIDESAGRASRSSPMRACRPADAFRPGRRRSGGSTATPRPRSRRDRRAWARSARRDLAARPPARPAPPGDPVRSRPCGASPVTTWWCSGGTTTSTPLSTTTDSPSSTCCSGLSVAPSAPRRATPPAGRRARRSRPPPARPPPRSPAAFVESVARGSQAVGWSKTRPFVIRSRFSTTCRYE